MGGGGGFQGLPLPPSPQRGNTQSLGGVKVAVNTGAPPERHLEAWRRTDKHGPPGSPLLPLTGVCRAQGGSGQSVTLSLHTLLLNPVDPESGLAGTLKTL